MKTHSLISNLLSLLLFLPVLSCSNNPLGFSKSTGMPYEIAVTMDKAVWEGEAGEAIRADLESEVPGLPQSEPALRVMFATSENFGSLLQYVRNVLIVNVNDRMYTTVNLMYENDRWAKDQVVLTLNAPDTKSVTDYLSLHKNELTKFFTKIEMNRATLSFEKDYGIGVRDSLKKKFDILMHVPSDMTSTQSKKDFFWTSNNAKTGRTDVIVYTFPYTDEQTFTGEYLIAKRDSVLKINLPGAFPDSYMATQTLAGIEYTPVTVRGKYCGVLRGLWKMVGDMMGGPFVSHIRLDEVNNRIVVVEGFVYAPETEKRNYIRRVEAALYTLRLPGEFDQPVAEPLKIK
ncbi:MAG: DUF4837 family protein [Tannerellaceae bacterium]|jgi:hypothetical protein|nr:DUF4837 family protein [Tannerellaceae bacterium]